MKIDIPALLVHLRARHVEAHREQHRLPTPEAVSMAAAAWVMGDPRRFAAAQRGSRAGRLLAHGDRGTRRWIRSLPRPLSAWTASRDVPEPPVESFREWWARTRGDRR